MPPAEVIDWSLARRIGRSVAGPGVAATRAEAEEIGRDFAEHVRRADKLVREFTGLEPNDQTGTAAVLSRGAWVDANVETIRALLRPLNERFADRFASTGGVARRLGASAMGVQVGILLGYVAQKVLGQYDLLLASTQPGRVYFVGPNIVATERRHNLDPADFRLWIALHEITHRTQFTAVPWLRGHVAGLIDTYLSGISFDRAGLVQLVSRVREKLAGGPEAWRKADIISIFLSEEQREVVNTMQSLMSVVEGHGNYVMDHVAEKEIPSFAQLRAALDARRASAGAGERAFQKLIALDLKYEQYRTGEQFFDAVHRRSGPAGVNLVWEGPANLPSALELRDPDAWLARVAPQRLFEP